VQHNNARGSIRARGEHEHTIVGHKGPTNNPNNTKTMKWGGRRGGGSSFER